jgi:hypothetical protein
VDIRGNCLIQGSNRPTLPLKTGLKTKKDKRGDFQLCFNFWCESKEFKTREKAEENFVTVYPAV